MITPSLIKAQIIQFLPVYTDLFAESINGDAVYSGGIITVNSPAHGLVTGDVIPVHSPDAINPITGVSFANGTATLTTTFNHDRTGSKDDFYETDKAELEGFADANYNGTFDIQSLPSRTEINIAQDADVVGALGSLIEKQFLLITSYSVTRIDNDNFSVVSPKQTYPDGTAFKNFKYITSARIYIASDAKRAIAMYTKLATDKAAMFIIFGPETVSKDRNSYSDAIIAATSQNSSRLTYLPQVSFLVFLNTSDDLSGAKAVQSIHEEIRPALLRTMFAHGFDQEDVSIQFRAAETDNSQGFYNTAQYLHSFTYQIPYQITIGQGDTFRANVAFDSILVDANMFDADGASIQAKVELEP